MLQRMPPQQWSQHATAMQQAGLPPAFPPPQFPQTFASQSPAGQPISMPHMWSVPGAMMSRGGPPPTIPPPAPAPAPAQPGAAADAPCVPAAATAQLRHLAGRMWYARNAAGAVWRYDIPSGGVEYRYEALSGERRTGTRDFSFTARGNLCRAGHELQKLEFEYDVVSNAAAVIAVRWADAMWVPHDLREAGGASSSDDAPRRAPASRSQKSGTSGTSGKSGVKYTVRVPRARSPGTRPTPRAAARSGAPPPPREGPSARTPPRTPISGKWVCIEAVRLVELRSAPAAPPGRQRRKGPRDADSRASSSESDEDDEEEISEDGGGDE
eukprot:gene519-1219_t